MRTAMIVPLVFTALLWFYNGCATSANARRAATTATEGILDDDTWIGVEESEYVYKEILDPEYEIDNDYKEEEQNDERDNNDNRENRKETEIINNEEETVFEGCAVDILQDVADQEPVILQKKCAPVCKWTLPEGDEDYLSFQKGEEILITCTDKNNKLRNFTPQPTSIVAVCSPTKSPNFEVNGKEYTIKDFACDRISKGEVKNKNEACGPRNAELMELGFNIINQWHPLIEVCHVKSRAETLFTEHILQGESSKPPRSSKRPTFEEGGQYQGFSINDAYKNANKTLREITGYSKFPSSISSNIDRGHLSPSADFPTNPYRYTTYFYVNTVPMWSVVNRGNWATLEEKIRKVAKKSTVDLRVATGVFRVMELSDKNGNTKEFFLYTTPTRKQLPVPKFVWKVLFDANSKKGIAFIILNDPFKRAIDSSDQLCPNICQDAGWNDRKWRTMSKGYLYCCEVKELKKFVSYVPKYDIKSILRGSN